MMRLFLLMLQIIFLIVALRTPGILGGIYDGASLYFCWAIFFAPRS